VQEAGVEVGRQQGRRMGVGSGHVGRQSSGVSNEAIGAGRTCERLARWCPNASSVQPILALQSGSHIVIELALHSNGMYSCLNRAATCMLLLGCRLCMINLHAVSRCGALGSVSASRNAQRVIVATVAWGELSCRSTCSVAQAEVRAGARWQCLGWGAAHGKALLGAADSSVCCHAWCLPRPAFVTGTTNILAGTMECEGCCPHCRQTALLVGSRFH
jgi:hypothetical protein